MEKRVCIYFTVDIRDYLDKETYLPPLDPVLGFTIAEFENMVIHIVCKVLKLDKKDLTADTRREPIPFARKLIVYCIYRFTKCTQEYVSQIVGINHSNVPYIIRTIHSDFKYNPYRKPFIKQIIYESSNLSNIDRLKDHTGYAKAPGELCFTQVIR